MTTEREPESYGEALYMSLEEARELGRVRGVKAVRVYQTLLDFISAHINGIEWFRIRPSTALPIIENSLKETNDAYEEAKKIEERNPELTEADARLERFQRWHGRLCYSVQDYLTRKFEEGTLTK